MAMRIFMIWAGCWHKCCCFLLCSAPLVAGIIKSESLAAESYRFQYFPEYFDLYKWWQKPTILTPYTSLVFIIAPLVYFASVVVAAAMLPNFLELNSVLEMSLFRNL